MKKRYQLLILTFVLSFSVFLDFPGIAQDVDFQSSNLPIVVIDMGGQAIPDDPKATAHMGIIYNGEGNRNNLTDPFNEYDGAIGIELRGASSKTYPKKPYGIETRLADGENNNVSLFGMPEENDWILYNPYADKTLIRNVLMYRLASDLGWYSPRTQFCELVLNGEYMGIYVFVEKIKRDKNRVNIPKPDSSDITGGYLCEMIVNSDLRDDETHFKLPVSQREIVVKYPKPEDITTEQHSYIADYFSEFETVLNSDLFNDPSEGYSKYIDLSSFIDFMLLSESSNQLDALSHSVFFYKNKNEKLCMGPGWDYNRCIGAARYYTSWSPTVWWLREPYGDNVELWYRVNWAKRLMLDPEFMKAYSKRWFELRQTFFSFNYLYDLIDSYALVLDEAKTRNFERWPVLGVLLNNKYVFDTYEEEIDYMKGWIEQKYTWLDEQFSVYGTTATAFSQESDSADEYDRQSARAYPNPFSSSTTISFSIIRAGSAKIEIFDLTGRKISTLLNEWRTPGLHEVRFDASNLNSGYYTFTLNAGEHFETGKILLLK
jgi:CotH protein/type IX secretion system substrate protein